MDAGHDEMLEWLNTHEIENKDSDIGNDHPLKNLTIDIHGKTAVEAEFRISALIERCLKDRIPILTVIHGKGIHSGDQPVLRDLVYSLLTIKYRSNIKSFNSAKEKNGGTGVTIIKFKMFI